MGGGLQYHRYSARGGVLFFGPVSCLRRRLVQCGCLPVRSRRDQRTVAAPAGPQSLNSGLFPDLEGYGNTERSEGYSCNLRSCHTAEIAGYLIEGHVAAAATRVLLYAAPFSIRGCVTDAPSDSYDVIALDPGSSLRSRDSRAQQL